MTHETPDPQEATGLRGEGRHPDGPWRPACRPGASPARSAAEQVVDTASDLVPDALVLAGPGRLGEQGADVVAHEVGDKTAFVTMTRPGP